MNKKYIFPGYIVISIIIYGMINNVWALETTICPTVAEIKSTDGSEILGWLPFYTSNDDEPIQDSERILQFRQLVTGFYVAEWSAIFPLSGHCYYHGDGEVLLARVAPKPNLSKNWHLVSAMVMQCDAVKVQDCHF